MSAWIRTANGGVVINAIRERPLRSLRRDADGATSRIDERCTAAMRALNGLDGKRASIFTTLRAQAAPSRPGFT
jgi:hypothetical protein